MESKKYIIYQINNKINNMIYIGAHITKNINDSYMGSGTNIKKAIKEFGMENFEKIILYQFDNLEDMIDMENKIVNKEFISRNDVYNLCIGGGFFTKDLATVKDKDGNIFDVHINDPRYLSGELVGATKGNVVAFDKNGNSFYISMNDTRYNSELICLLKNKMPAINKITNKIELIDRKEFNKEFYYGRNKDLVLSKDLNNNYLCAHKDDLRFKEGLIFPFSKGLKHTFETKKKIGEKNSINQTGEKNSQYGKCWIHNNVKSMSIKLIELNKYLEDGWIRGRINVHNK